MKYKHWDDESDDYVSFQKVKQKPKTNKSDKKKNNIRLQRREKKNALQDY